MYTIVEIIDLENGRSDRIRTSSNLNIFNNVAVNHA